MQKFIKKIFGFLLFSLLISILIFGIVYYFEKENLPAFNFSNSYSYNEKLSYFKKSKVKSEVIAIGSSTTLNNLHSEVVIKNMGSSSFFNLSSWGLQIDESYKLLKIIYELSEFRKIIIVSSLGDFQSNNKEIDYKFVNYYLNQNNLLTTLFAIKNFSLSYYIENLSFTKHVKNCSRDYQYLNYDKYGMVKFEKKGFNINKKRWSDNCLNISTSEVEYFYLDSISDFCSKNNIELYFFHSPHREGLFTSLGPKEKGILDAHTKKIESILKDNHFFVNSNEVIWNDSLFVDGIHLNELGAKYFTEYCFRIKNEKEIK